MSTIKYELFGSEACVASHELGTGELLLIFPEGTEGFIRIGARIYKLSASKAKIDPSELDDGPHTPHLFTSLGECYIPGIIKNGKTLTLAPQADEDLRMNVLRTRRLENAISSLEKQLLAIQDKIEKTTIF